MQPRILVTGAGGNVGAEVVKVLREEDVAVRAADRKGENLRERLGERVEAVRFDFARPETFAPALQGVDRLFLVRPPAIADTRKFIFPAIDAAIQAGVQHIVFLSLIGVEQNRFLPHHKIEQYIAASGVPYTFLRPSFSMQNLNTTHRREIKERSEIFVPAGRGRTSFVDVRDIAAVARLALMQPEHTNQTYELTGADALDYYQVAEQLSDVLGRTITYRNPSLLRFILRHRSAGTALPFILVMAAIFTTARLGWAGRTTEDTARLLHRPPISFRQYAEDYQESWSNKAGSQPRHA